MSALLATLSLGVAAVFAVFVVRPRCGRLAAGTHALIQGRGGFTVRGDALVFCLGERG